MTDPEQASDVTLCEPRDVGEFVQARGISAHELELYRGSSCFVIPADSGNPQMILICGFPESAGQKTNSQNVVTRSIIAIVTGWQQRAPRKITPAALLSALCVQSLGGTASFNDIATALDDASGRQPARQSVAERFAEPCLRMIQTVLRLAIDKRLTTSMQEDAPAQGLLSSYARVLVQDSTIIELPGWLFDTFCGVANGARQVCNARIQATCDLKNMGFEAFSIDACSKNDVSAEPELELRPGDLVLRDRGYT